MLKIGLPAGAQQTFVSLGFLVLTAFVNGFGDKVVAAYGAAGRTDNFSFLPAMTFSLAISSGWSKFGSRGYYPSQRSGTLGSYYFSSFCDTYFDICLSFRRYLVENFHH